MRKARVLSILFIAALLAVAVIAEAQQAKKISAAWISVRLPAPTAA